jgi:hypothetical protein
MAAVKNRVGIFQIGANRIGLSVGFAKHFLNQFFGPFAGRAVLARVANLGQRSVAAMSCWVTVMNCRMSAESRRAIVAG